MYTDNGKIGKCPTDGLEDSTITAEAKYSVNITKLRKKICLNFTLQW